MDISVNKSAKEYLKKEFEDWYSELVMQQLDGKDIDDLESIEIQPINLGMPIKFLDLFGISFKGK